MFKYALSALSLALASRYVVYDTSQPGLNFSGSVSSSFLALRRSVVAAKQRKSPSHGPKRSLPTNPKQTQPRDAAKYINSSVCSHIASDVMSSYFARALNKAPTYLAPRRRPTLPRTLSNSSDISISSNRSDEPATEAALSAPGTPTFEEQPRSTYMHMQTLSQERPDTSNPTLERTATTLPICRHRTVFFALLSQLQRIMQCRWWWAR